MAFIHTRDSLLATRNAPRIFWRPSFLSSALSAALLVRVAFALLVSALLFSIASVAAAETGAARTLQSLASVRSAAEEHVRLNSETNAGGNTTLFVNAGELDARLQLAQCASALTTFTLNSAPIVARTTVGVRCPPSSNSADWTVYVPLAIESEIDVFVLRNSMPRDAHLSMGDLDMQRRRVPGLSTAYISNEAMLRDQHLKRGIPAGTTLTADLLTRDLVVKRGQQVVLVFSAGGLAVQAPGLALADGGTADRIRVQNQTSLKVVEGVIESGNLVRVGM